VFHVYVGYPVSIYLKAYLRKDSKPMQDVPSEDLPFVTVLIPAHNEERWIARKIENALALDYPTEKLQILVASDGSTDGTVDIVQKYANRGVELNHALQRTGKTATLNRVVPTAKGAVVLLTDCNALLQPDSVRLLIRHFQDPDVGCVTGERVCLPTESSASEGEGLYWRYEAWIKHSESQLGSCLGSNGQVLAFRKILYPTIPVIGDDFYIPMKILVSTTARVRFEPGAKAMIPSAATLKLELERKVRSHVSLLRDLPHLRAALNPMKSRIWWRFLSHHVSRLFVPFALLSSLLLSPAVWKSGPVYQGVVLAQFAFYVLATVGYFLRRQGYQSRIFYVPFYFLFANFGVLLAWIRWARKKHQYAWQRTERILPMTEPANRV
jgi:poly-beta-1,6-N-acetyl-D-glucosamine synthase